MSKPSKTASKRTRDGIETSANQDDQKRAGGIRRVFRSFAKWVLGGVISYFALCSLLLILYNWTYPPTTGVQIQRRVESLFAGNEQAAYRKLYEPVEAEGISQHLLHAVVAAEDTRFFEHAGFDWDAIREAYDDGMQRGGSTISQQLAKNLFLTTHRSYVRKAVEVPLTFLTELMLSKDRILDLYVNVVEWGPGIYGAEMAARTYYGVGANSLGRVQAAALASSLPNPRHRRPRVNSWYTNVILRRMSALGY